MKNMWQWQEPGTEKGPWLIGAGVALAVLLVIVLVLAFWWSRAPKPFWVTSDVSGQRAPIGYSTTQTLIEVTELLLDKPGGFLSNDIAPPGIFLDNIPSWEFGVVVQVRDLARALRNDYSRSQSQSTEDVDLARAASEGSPYAGADMLDIIVHGVGTHGASPHKGKDPIVLASQIVLALQTLVARELPPRDPGVVTVGSFHSGTKHNIISDRAVLQLTVRNTSLETRKLLLDGIKRIAENMGRAAGLPEDKLPEVVLGESCPPTINDTALAQRLKKVWTEKMGADAVLSDAEVKKHSKGMGAEDFPFFTTDPPIRSVYFAVGGTPKADFDREKAGGAFVPASGWSRRTA